MKKWCVLFSLGAVFAFAAGTAMAEDSIKGRLGVTGRIGFLVPADSEVTENSPVLGKIGTDTGFVGGGGFIYGITDNIAAEFDITHTSFGSDAGTDFNTTNLSLGVQYRFLNIPVRHLVPYAGAGLDILLNGADSGIEVDNTVGAHLCGGVDYFILRQLALTSEIKGVIAPNADVSVAGVKIGNFDPSSFSMTFGVRYFFN